MSDHVLIPVPAHITHSGPEDGSECSLCQFYRNGYWTAADAMLDHSQQQWLKGYDGGKLIGKLDAQRQTEDVVKFFFSCIAVGLLLGIMLRVIVDKRLEEQQRLATDG